MRSRCSGVDYAWRGGFDSESAGAGTGESEEPEAGLSANRAAAMISRSLVMARPRG